MIRFVCNRMRYVLGTALLSIAIVAFCPHCSGESEAMARKKLDAICEDDLAAIIDSIAVENLIEKPYYKIVEYNRYSEGKYTRKAVVEYFFLRRVAVKVVRKYRYHGSIGLWDRYTNEYVFLHDSSAAVQTGN